MRLLTAFAITLLFVTFITAVKGTSGAGSPQIPPRPVSRDSTRHEMPVGKSLMYLSPGVAPTSVRELVRESDVVVDADVSDVLPARFDGTFVRTDSILQVRRVFKGRTERLRTILVTQMGGKNGA